MQTVKFPVDKELLTELEQLCLQRGWNLARGLAIATEAGIRVLQWDEKFGSASDQHADAIAIRRELVELSSRLSSIKFQNFQLSKDNQNYELREGSLRSRIRNLEQQLLLGKEQQVLKCQSDQLQEVGKVLASHVMTKEVITVKPETTLRQAVDLMLRHRISGLPVVDDNGRLVGLLVENDLVLGARTGLPVHLQLLEDLLNAKKPDRHEEQLRELANRPVKEYMSTELVTASPDTPLRQLVALLVSNDFKRIPIVEGERLVGIVSRADIIKVMR